MTGTTLRLRLGVGGGGATTTRLFAVDGFGNIQGYSTDGSWRGTPTTKATNRFAGTAVYDSAGNVTAWNGHQWQLGPFNLPWHWQVGTQEWIYAYTADDERLFAFQVFGDEINRWTLRDLDGTVLTEYTWHRPSGNWTLEKDYIHRGSQLLAAETTSGTHHFTLDHLGTPRLVTDDSKAMVAYHVYYPYGEEATAFNQTAERRRFTGHERDLGSLSGPSDDMDYMHARYYSPVMARFLAVDPAMESVDPRKPQTWNRYNYVAANPINYVDPTGEILFFFFNAPSDSTELQRVANDYLHGVDLQIGSSGQASLVANNEVGPPTPEQQAFADVFADAISRPEPIGINVTSGDSSVIFGEYRSGKVDIQDVALVGPGRGVSDAAVLAHEIAEQTFGQTDTRTRSRAAYNRAHAAGIAAQERVSGYMWQSTTLNLNGQLTGQVVGVHSQGRRLVTVTFQFVNGDLVRSPRRQP